MSSISEANPFVGPRSIQPGETLPGRMVEVRDLYHRLQARRIVVLHSPSGAGKSSLVNAGLIPKLRESKFDVWKPIRVNLDPAGLDGTFAGTNRYLLSAMLSLEEELPAGRRRTPEELAGLEFADYLLTRPRRKGSAQQAVVLLFDQFEEILTVAPWSIEEKRAFFREVGKALANENVWALFIVRADYLAALAPYRELIPTQLANTFHLDLLGLERAREAAQQLAGQGGRSFPGVERLVQDLSTVQVQQPDGSFRPEQGAYVEPVQLQVVCRRLWEAMPEGDLSIDNDDVARYADVTKALAAYYAQSVEKVARGNLAVERAIRDWMGNKLIVSGIRSQVRQAAGQSGGLDNALITELLGHYLVRCEQRAGAHWYELSHDRLVAPIRADNEAWERAHLHPMQVHAATWEASGRKPELLLSAEALVGAAAWAKSHAQLVTPAEREYLVASQTLRDQEAKLGRRQRRLVQTMVLGLAAGVASVFFYLEAQRSGRAARDTLRTFIGSALADSDVVASLGILREVESTDTPGWSELVLDLLARGMPRQELLGHQSRVTAVAFSPDGKMVATGSHDRSVQIWNAHQPGRPVVLSGGMVEVSSLAFSPNGQAIAVGALDGKVWVWSTRGKGEPLVLAAGQEQLLPAEPVMSVAFSPDGKKIAAASYDKTVRVWDSAGKGEPVTTLQHADKVLSVAFSPDGKRLVSGSQDDRVLVWTIDGTEQREVGRHNDDVSAVQFSPDGKKVASASDDMTVRIWDADGKGQLAELRGHKDVVRSVAFSHDGKSLASSSDDNTVRIWDADGKGQPDLHRILYAHALPINSVAFSPDGKLLATSSNDRSVRIWNANGLGWDQVLALNDGMMTSVAFSRDGTRMAGSSEATVCVWTASAIGKPLRLVGHEDAVLSLAFNPVNGGMLATGSLDTSVRIWKVDGSAPAAILTHYQDAAIAAVGFSPDGGTLFSCSQSGQVAVRELSKPSRPAKLVQLLRNGEPQVVNAAAFSPDGKKLAMVTGDPNGTTPVCIWNTEGQGEPRCLEGHRGPVRAVAFSQDGTRLATASADKTVRIWNAAGTGKPVIFEGHQGEVLSVTFSADGRKIASGAGSGDHTVRIWRADGAGEPQILPGRGSQQFSALAFAPDGKKLLFGSDDSTLRIAALEKDGDELRDLLFRVTPHCLPPERRQKLLRESEADARHAYERCRRQVAHYN